MITVDNLKLMCKELGLSSDRHTLRRLNRAYSLYFSGKVEHIDDPKAEGVGGSCFSIQTRSSKRLISSQPHNHSFVVASQFTKGRSYHVRIKESEYLPAGAYSWCTCQDWRNYFWCKHSLASLLFLRREMKETWEQYGMKA
jgi:hypothetical protein